tara:strand:- start:261 stop:590 length:330 start_codon:yes stop_codon:yes gene_type:complete
MKDELILDVESWNIKLIPRKRNRMKLQIKLNKEESEAYKAFSSTVKPEGINDDQFIKSIFFYGIEALNQSFVEMVQNLAESDPEKAKELGIIQDDDEDDVEFIDASEEE